MIEIDFNKMDGLTPAIVQDDESGEVLMLAFMNEEAWEATLKTGKATYYSRSRNQLWIKGETSGNVQIVKEIRVDGKKIEGQLILPHSDQNEHKVEVIMG